MQSLVVFVAIFGLALAAIRPAPYRAASHSSDDKSAEVLKAFSDISPDGGYQWSYETSNGIAADEQGRLTGNAKEPSVQAQGSYSYTAPDGTPIQVTYVADENGFQPSGAHLPVPPPIPEAILRSLAWNEKHPEQPLSFSGKQKLFY